MKSPVRCFDDDNNNKVKTGLCSDQEHKIHMCNYKMGNRKNPFRCLLYHFEKPYSSTLCTAHTVICMDTKC